MCLAVDDVVVTKEEPPKAGTMGADHWCRTVPIGGPVTRPVQLCGRGPFEGGTLWRQLIRHGFRKLFILGWMSFSEVVYRKIRLESDYEPHQPSVEIAAKEAMFAAVSSVCEMILTDAELDSESRLLSYNH